MAKLPGCAVPETLLDPRTWVADIVYFPLETPLLRTARARGCRTLPGSGMAVFKAVRAFELDLAPDLLERLAAANILYDEQNGRAFLQLYSQVFASGMFFEIVQRAPGYGGYGAPNAPFRIAAQKRLGRPRGLPRE